MSKVRAEQYTNRAGSGAPEIPYGVTVPEGASIDGAGGLNLTGIATAGTFKGSIDATTASFSGNVSIAGTLTYEDVTNIDSVGVITATEFSGTTGTFSGNVSVGGTLTYEDVTNIDSVGLITARNGLIVTGVTTTGGITIKGPASTNVLIGQDAGASWSGAQQCVGVGYYALQSNTNSNFCTAVGTQALSSLGSNTGSSYTGNTAIGLSLIHI